MEIETISRVRAIQFEVENLFKAGDRDQVVIEEAKKSIETLKGFFKCLISIEEDEKKRVESQRQKVVDSLDQLKTARFCIGRESKRRQLEQKVALCADVLEDHDKAIEKNRQGLKKCDELISSISEMESLDSIPVTTLELKDVESSKSRLDSLKNKVASLGKWAVRASRAHMAYNLIDHGLSSLLVLDTFYHGTGPLGYIGINLFGAKPSLGGNADGSGAGLGQVAPSSQSLSVKYMEVSKGLFHLFSQSSLDRRLLPEEPVHPLIYMPLTRVHASLSAVASFNKVGLPKLGGLLGILTPTLKFRFTREQVLELMQKHRWEKDPDYVGCEVGACRTDYPIPMTHLGITGSLLQGVNGDLFERMKKSPKRVLLGLGLVLAGGYVARSVYRSLKESEKIQENKTSDSQKTFLRKAASGIQFAARCVFGEPFMILLNCSV